MAKTSKREQIDTLATLEKVVRRARDIADDGEDLLRRIREAPRVSPEVGKFYQSFDGSVLYVARERHECQCRICRAGRAAAEATDTGGVLGVLLSQVPGMQPSAAADEDDDVAHKDRPDGPPVGFVAVIIRGGHGIAAFRGEEPGETVSLEGDGLAAYGKVDDKDQSAAVSLAFAAFAGLSLLREVTLKIGD